MTDIDLIAPPDVMQRTAQRAKALRLAQNITQQELADKVGIAVGTVKRFEKSGEIQFNHLLRIALVLGRLEDFSSIFAVDDVPASLYDLKAEKVRQRAMPVKRNNIQTDRKRFACLYNAELTFGK
jgi:transcriptional regulator with XRE-family HTH domain